MHTDEQALKLLQLLEEARVHVRRHVEDNTKDRTCMACGADGLDRHDDWCFIGQAELWLIKVEPLLSGRELT